VRLLHTSDWHLGRFLKTVSLAEHQREFLTWLAALARTREIDAVLISGDVYDRAIPSVDAVPMLERGLVDLSAACPVILIAGNHDSPTRLGFGGPLFEASGVHLRSSLDDISRPVEVTGADGGSVLVYGIPYLEPEVVRGRLEAQKSHEAVLTAAMDLIRTDLAQRTAGIESPARAVVLAHAFITGGTRSDSERDISVGGIDHAPASVFAGVDYVALGHLHGPQAIADDGVVVRYSGSPLPYSFSEQDHVKSVTIVEIDPTGAIEVEQVPTPVPRSMCTITGDVDFLLSDATLANAEEAWVRAIVTDPRRPENAMDRLRWRFPHAIELAWLPHLNGVPLTSDGDRVDPTGTEPIDIVTSFIEHVTSVPATDEERTLVHASVERQRIGEAGA
jgi:exonuclease SbcD